MYSAWLQLGEVTSFPPGVPGPVCATQNIHGSRTPDVCQEEEKQASLSPFQLIPRKCLKLPHVAQSSAQVGAAVVE